MIIPNFIQDSDWINENENNCFLTRFTFLLKCQSGFGGPVRFENNQHHLNSTFQGDIYYL